MTFYPALIKSVAISCVIYVLFEGVRAKQLLRFTDMTVDEVGAAVGMGDANYFSRMFRKVEGTSPREYRKQW